MKVEPKRGRPPVEGEAATGHIHIRTTMARKSAYVRAAKPKKLTDWITENLDRAAGYSGEEKQRLSRHGRKGGQNHNISY